MNVFVAGASGAIGQALVPQLVAAGYQVVAMTRSQRHVARLRAMGAEPALADALDRAAVMEAVRRAQPDVIIHELTALTGLKDFKHFDRAFALTNRLRTEGTDILLAAAREVGARRFIAQSYGNWIYARTGSAAKTEDDALDPTPPANQRETLAAICYLENAVVGAEGIEGVALRYGGLYGPHTNMASNGDVAAMVRKRMYPVVGEGAGVWSFLHVQDAASATVAAIEHGAPDVYNIADDEPAPVRAWLPAYARALGAPPPLRIPTWLGKLMVGEVGVSLMTQQRGESNARAKRELGWTPSYASWREGFKGGLG
jgi:nucleoside-diphosphate-sugar epimerase